MALSQELELRPEGHSHGSHGHGQSQGQSSASDRWAGDPSAIRASIEPTDLPSTGTASALAQRGRSAAVLDWLHTRPQAAVALTFASLGLLGVIAARIDLYHQLVGGPAITGSWWPVALIHLVALLPIWGITAWIVSTVTAQERLVAARLAHTDAVRERILAILGEVLIEPAANLAESAELLREADLRHQDLEELVPLLRTSATATHQVLADLLLWARHQQGQQTRSIGAVHLGEALENACARAQERFTSRELTLTWPTSSAVVLTDREVILAILRNLLAQVALSGRRGTAAVIDLPPQDAQGRWTIRLRYTPQTSGSRTRAFPRRNRSPVQSWMQEGAIHAICRDLVEQVGGHWSLEVLPDQRLEVQVALPGAGRSRSSTDGHVTTDAPATTGIGH